MLNPQDDQLGATVRAQRRRRGWRRLDLASRAGVAIATIGRIESGAIATPLRSTLSQIERALNLGPGELERLVVREVDTGGAR